MSIVRPVHIIALLLGYLAVLLGLAVTLPSAAFEFVFIEGGLVERASIVFWIALAGLVMAVVRPVWRLGVPAAVLSILCAAREADWHKQFTGYSVLKPGYFLGPQFPLAGKLLAGTIIAIGVVSTILLLDGWIRHIRRAGFLHSPWQRITAIAVVVLALSKIADRAPAMLRDSTGTELPLVTLRLGLAYEEGMECVIPLVLAAAIAAFAVEKRHGMKAKETSRPAAAAGGNGPIRS